MATMIFGIPPRVDVSTVLSACEGLDAIELVGIERVVRDGRRVRWLVLMGDETEHVGPVLVALSKAVGMLVVVVADDDTWRLFELGIDGARLVVRFDDRGDEWPAVSMKHRLSERTSDADAADISAGDVPRTFETDSWQHFERASDGSPSFVALDLSSVVAGSAERSYALFWPELYDWQAEDEQREQADDDEDAVDAPARDGAAPSEPTREELVARIRSGNLRAERLMRPAPNPRDASRKQTR